MTRTPPPEALWPLITGVRNSQLVYAAAKTGIADMLGDEPRGSVELAHCANVDARMLHRVLRGLATLDIVTEDDDGRFRLAPLGSYLRTDHPDSLRGWAIIAGELHYAAWAGFLESLRTGRSTVDETLGTSLWQYLQQHPELGEHLNREMVRRSGPIAAAVLEAYDFEATDTVVDVGGGWGAMVASILKAVPGTRGVLFDLPSVVEGGQRLLEREGVAHRCTVIAGDFFESVPPAGSVYLFKDVLHNWDDERSQLILINCRAAMPPGARLLVIEMLMPARACSDPLAVQLDLQMLVVSGGRERTLAEYRELFAATGFTVARVLPTSSGLAVLEARPVSRRSAERGRPGPP